jgi:hypothetical protein
MGRPSRAQGPFRGTHRASPSPASCSAAATSAAFCASSLASPGSVTGAWLGLPLGTRVVLLLSASSDERRQRPSKARTRAKQASEAAAAAAAEPSATVGRCALLLCACRGRVDGAVGLG